MRNRIRVIIFTLTLALLVACSGLRHVIYKPDPGCARRTLLKYTGVDDPGALWVQYGSTTCAESKDGKRSACVDPPYRECR